MTGFGVKKEREREREGGGGRDCKNQGRLSNLDAPCWQSRWCLAVVCRNKLCVFAVTSEKKRAGGLLVACLLIRLTFQQPACASQGQMC